jgi:hypothetical protein
LKIDVNGNVWVGDVDGHVNFKFSPEGRLLMILGNRQGVPNGNDSKTGFNRPTNFWPLANGNMLISDGYGSSRIIEFTNDGPLCAALLYRPPHQQQFFPLRRLLCHPQDQFLLPSGLRR